MAAERPELVFHAAALKHVPIVEANPCEGILTNVLGTRHVAEACRAIGVKTMVMISTDKAVNPGQRDGRDQAARREPLPGARHRRSASARRARAMSPCASATCWARPGSVVPLFQRQLAAGGPLTVTHPEIARFFMTVREAVELVLQASALGVADAASAARSSCSTWASRSRSSISRAR